MALASAPRAIRIVLLSGLGDVIHGLPLINAIRDDNPECHITWVVEPMPSAILAGHPSIDRVVVFRRRDGLAGMRQLWRDLRAGLKPDLTLNLNVYLKSAWPTLAARGPRRIGFGRERSFDGVWLAANEHLPAALWAHTADMFMEFGRHIGLSSSPHEWRIEFTEEEQRLRDEFFGKFNGRPVATIVPASASIKKDWIAERWAEVADVLESDFGFKVVVAGGPGDREQAIAQTILDCTSAKIEWAMGDSVRRLAWIVGGSDLLVAPDTGPVHIARALGVPVIGIYGHTNPWRVGPWRRYSDLWVDKYTDPDTLPDPSNREPKWNVMPAITTDDVVGRIAVAADRYMVARDTTR